MTIELILIAGFAALVAYNLRNLGGTTPKHVVEHKTNPQLEQELAYAARLYADHKYLAAEKAYLSVLKHDHKNNVAYTRLGKIYLALKNYPDAIESLRIAAQLSPTAHSQFNLGQAYYENKNYIKAIAAFEKAIMFEPSAGRYAALAKTHQRLSSLPKAVEALEKAVELQPEPQFLRPLYDAYRASRQTAKAAAIQQKLAGTRSKSIRPAPRI
jgi:tetratricopeptide (TPR) repeat protein